MSASAFPESINIGSGNASGSYLILNDAGGIQDFRNKRVFCNHFYEKVKNQIIGYASTVAMTLSYVDVRDVKLGYPNIPISRYPIILGYRDIGIFGGVGSRYPIILRYRDIGVLG